MLICVFLTSFVLLLFLRKLAPKVGLLDNPNERKHHQGRIPLIGGICVTLAIICILMIYPQMLAHNKLFVICITILAIIGALDDRFDISASFRMLIQAAIALMVIFHVHLSVESLGNLFGTGSVFLGKWGIVFTILGIIGTINAFNMIDGIDGLLGTISMVTLFSIGILSSHHNDMNTAMFCWAVIFALLPYTAMNLGVIGKRRKIFMGDSGSMVIGFTIIWLLIKSSQPGYLMKSVSIAPVTALWLIMVPLMDMARVMLRRLQNRCSPFKADRSHLHHILQDMGFSSLQTLIIITLLSLIFAGIGIVCQIHHVAELWMLLSFIVCFVVYYYLFNHIGSVLKTTQKRYPKIHQSIVTGRE